MEALEMKEKRKSQRVPAELTVLGELDGRQVGMCSENISLEGMFLFSREFVRPHAVFSARVWIGEEDAPLKVYMTACFTERSWTGYGIGVSLSGISPADRTRWEEFYNARAAASGENVRQILQSERTVKNRRILVIEGSLSALAVQALRKQGLQVSHAPTIDQALALMKREPVEAIISDLHRPGRDGLVLCSQVNGARLPVRTVLLTSGLSSKDFLLGLYAGATRVIAKPCSNDLLVNRVLEVLRQRLPGGRAAASDPSAELASVNGAANPSLRYHPPTPLLSARQVALRASQCLGEVYRYVSARWA